MASKNTGKKFEHLAESIFKRLIDDPEYEKVQHNVWVEGPEGKRQVDVLVTKIKDGIELNTVIECKDEDRKIPIGVIDAFHSKLMDINANNGVLISWKGFSSKAISKANRVGIKLCTAHEALSTKWKINFNLPSILESVQPIEYELLPLIDVKKGETINALQINEINDFSVVNLLFDAWENNEIKYKCEDGFQEVYLKKLKPPYKFPSKTYNNEITIIDYKVKLKLKWQYYMLPIHEIDKTQVLYDITERINHVLMNLETIMDIREEFVEINPTCAREMVSARLGLHVTPVFEGLKNLNTVKVKPIDNNWTNVNVKYNRN